MAPEIPKKTIPIERTTTNVHMMLTKKTKLMANDCNDKLSKLEKNNNDTLESSVRVNDQSKNIVSVMSKKMVNNSNKVYSSKLITKQQSKINHLRDYDELVSLFDKNHIPTNIKYKLGGSYKTLKNVQPQNLDFLSGNKSFNLNIVTGQNSNKISKNNNNNNNNNILTKLEGIKSKSSVVSPKIKSSIKIQDVSNNSTNETTTKSTTMFKTTNKNPIESEILMKNNKELQMIRFKNELNEEKRTTLLESKSNRLTNQIKSITNCYNNIQTNNNDININKKSYNIPTVLNNIDKIINKNLQQQDDKSNIKNQFENNPKMLETNLTSNNVLPKYLKSNKRNIKNGRNIRRIKTNNLLCESSIKLFKIRDNYSSNQRWSGLDLTASGCCCPLRNSRSNGSTSKKGSTRPYTSNVQTREVSSKCYIRNKKDPIVKSNILSFDPNMFKRRNLVSGVTVSTTTNTNTKVTNPDVYSTIQPNRILLRFNNKLSPGLTKNNQQSYSYGSCNKSKKSNNDDNSCCKKRKKECEEDTMIPGKVICTKPKRDCSKPKRCRSKKKVCCTKKSSPPSPSPKQRSSCCKTKPKKTKICKRYCCPALQVEDCVIKPNKCPKKPRSKCDNDFTEDYQREQQQQKQQQLKIQDPTCLPIVEKPKSQIYDNCNNNNINKDENDCCTNSSIKKCNKDRNENDDDCSDEMLFNKSKKKKDCSNTRRNSRRSSNNWNKRRYHHSVKKSLTIRKIKSSVTIPMFDVSVVSLRPYQNDTILRFYSNRNSSYENDHCHNDKNKRNCRKPIGPPKCLNKISKEDICNRSKIIQDPCDFQRITQNVCDKSEMNICQSAKGINK
ncbi:hypothetical protein M0804_012564 [Polistes exclamans]|nr:hypothetical protein M0804_012564 [Polistes exclamans]